MRKLVYYIATSIDGFIADPHGDFGFFPNHPDTVTALFQRYPETCPVHMRVYFGINAKPVRFDTVIMGANTHRPAIEAGLTSAYPHLQQFVVTHSELPADDSVTFVDGDIVALVQRLKSQPGQDIWLCGGSNMAGQLFGEIDELQVKINPVVVGTGKQLFGMDFGQSDWKLTNHELMPADVMLLTYQRAD